MSEYSEQDLRYASELRETIHREALEIIQKTRPEIREVTDDHPVEDYFQQYWDYPGKWYTIVAIPYGYKNRKAFVDTIVRNTLAANTSAKEKNGLEREPGRRRLSNQLSRKPTGYRELFTVETDQKKRSIRAVGVDSEGQHILEHYEEYSIGSTIGSAGAYYVLTDQEFRRYARMALVNGHISSEDHARFTSAISSDN